MNHKQLLAFIKVVEEGGFTQAAKCLYMTQPAISWQIKSLEEDLELLLLERKERNIQLTDAGKIFYDHAKRIVGKYEELFNEIEQFKGMERGSLSLGASTIPGEYIIPYFIGIFKKEYPTIDISMQIADTGYIVDFLLHDDIHLGIIGAKVKEQKIDLISFIEDEIILIANKNHPLARRNRVGLSDLKSEFFIIREKSSGTQMVIKEELEKKNINLNSLNVVMELGSTRAVVTAVEAGLGISWVSKCALKDVLKTEEIKQINLQDFSVKRELFLAYNNRRTLSPLTNAFKELLLDKEVVKKVLGN